MDNSIVLRTAGIADDSIVDGPGIRFTVFVQGCPHNCEDCHNPQTHSFTDGKDMTVSEILSKIAENPLLDGVTFSGGEPFCQAKSLSVLGEEIRALGLGIITYSGYTYEYLTEHSNDENCYEKLLCVSDYLVDGPFVKDKKDISLRFRGSSNQRIIDVKASLENGTAVIAEL